MGCSSSKDSKKHKVEAPAKYEAPNNIPEAPKETVPPEEPKILLPVDTIKQPEPNIISQSPKEEKTHKVEAIDIACPEPEPERTLNKSPSRINLVPVDSCCYFFGIDTNNEQKILKFDPRNDSFTPMPIPANFEIYNMSSCVYVSEACIYITGGTNANATQVSNRLFLYNPTQNTCKELESFSVERYTHQSILFNDQLYIIGGLGPDLPPVTGKEEEENVLKSVEKYDTKFNNWVKIKDLKYSRSLCSVIIYKDCLYVLGGYTGETKRTRTIERLNRQANGWEVLEFKLPHGLESSFVYCPGPDTLQIIGGQDAIGSVNTSYIYNLKENNYIMKKPMHHERVLHKGFLHQDKIIIFGGDHDETMEEYHILKDEWIKQPSLFSTLVSGTKLFSYSHISIHIDHDPIQALEEPASPQALKSKKCFVFGDDDASFIMEINFTKDYVKERPIPANLKLYGYQGVTVLPDGTYLLCGGINKHSNHISTNTYCYNPKTGTAKKLAKSNQTRYTFNFTYMNGYAYAIGGRTWGEDNQAILHQCERYNVAQNVWEQIANLNHARCSAMTFQFNNKLYVLGGYKGESHRWSSVEVYSPEGNKWELQKVELKLPLEGSSLVSSNNKGGVYLLGGRTDDGDTDKIWEYNVEQGDMRETGILQEAKSLTKIYEYDERKVFIFGGERYMTEGFDLITGKSVDDSPFISKVSFTLRSMTAKGTRHHHKLLRFGLA